MFYDGAPLTLPASSGDNAARMHTDSPADNMGMYFQSISGLDADTEYVLSAYMWHLGKDEDGYRGEMTVDLNDAPNEAQLTRYATDEDASLGYFGYATFNTTDTGTSFDLRAFLVHPGANTGWPYPEIGALWNNISITKASEFVAPSTVASAFPLSIAPATGGGYDLTWTSQVGMLYDVWSTDDLSEDLVDWDLEQGDILATGASTTWHDDPTGPKLFYRVGEFLPLDEGFESDDGGFAANTTTAGTPWAHGAPTSGSIGSPNPGGFVDRGAGDSVNCWGIGIGNPGYYADPTTDSCLRSTVIDLTGVAAANLTFAQARDFPVGDTAVVRIIDEGTGTEIVSAPFPLTVADDDPHSANWANAGLYALPVGGEIRIEWCFSGTGDATDDYMGWYIDDVTVTPK